MQELQEQTRNSLIKLINRLIKGQNDSDLLQLFFKNADEQTFTNVISELSCSEPELDKQIQKIIYRLQEEVDSIVASLEDGKSEGSHNQQLFWEGRLELFKQYVEMSGYDCRLTDDGSYVIYCKLSLEGLNNDN